MSIRNLSKCVIKGDYTPAVPFTPFRYFDGTGVKGAYYDTFNITTLKQTAAGTGDVTTANDPVGYVQDLSGNNLHLSQLTDTSRPSWNGTCLQYDFADDELGITVPTPLTGTLLIAGVNGIATYGVNIDAIETYLGWMSDPQIVGMVLLEGNIDNSEAYTYYKDAGASSLWDANAFGGVTDFTQRWSNYNERDETWLTEMPIVDTRNGETFVEAWYGQYNMTSFPLLDFSSALSFEYAWGDCESLTSFPLITIPVATDTSYAWIGCKGLTSFPLIDISNVVNLQGAWSGCMGLTSFPLLDFSSAVNLSYAWTRCSGLTSFPLITIPVATDTSFTWEGCTGLTSFPLIDFSTIEYFTGAWMDCTGLATFPHINTSNGTDLSAAWAGCSNLATFPSIDTGNVLALAGAWGRCSSLTTFPSIDTSNCTGFAGTWSDCSSLSSFPALDLSRGTDFKNAWSRCTSLVDFPVVDIKSGADFQGGWNGCTNLANFPPNMFDTAPATNYTFAFFDCALPQASVDNILVSVNTAGQSNGRIDIHGGTNATPGAAGIAAVNALRSRGWTVTHN